MPTVIYWFHRDLRVADNLGLATALASGAQVVPLFVLDPQLAPAGDVPTTRTVLWRALNALDQDLQAHGSRLICRLGEPAEIIPALVRETQAAAVYLTRMPGGYALRRDERVAAAMQPLGTPLYITEDTTLVPVDALRTGAGNHYTVFTPFAKQWLEWLRHHEPAQVVVPRQRLKLAAALRDLPGSVAEAFAGDGGKADKRLPEFAISASAAQQRLAFFTGMGADSELAAAPITRYHHQRDILSVDGTSRLSVHLAWGTLSIRAAYLAALATARASDAAGREGCRVWVNELAWRDFYHQILNHAPHAEHGAYQEMFGGLAWDGAEADFDVWCRGRTGYPIVDAAMRQMRQTGWMHNRGRMIVASFLAKDLLLNWQLGEKYFAQRLIDYDIANNNGGWQWSVSTGTDAQPFRVFNPTFQGERYDPDGVYVKQWVPELAKVPAEVMHTPWKLTAGEHRAICPDYPPPIVDHAERRTRAIAMYTTARMQHKQAQEQQGKESRGESPASPPDESS